MKINKIHKWWYKRNNQKWILLFGFILFIVILTILYTKKTKLLSLEIFIAGIALLTTIYFSIYKNWLDHDKIFIDLFHQMNYKFDLLNEDLNQIVKDKNFKPEKGSKESVIQDYLNLCSEEYLWYKKGRIDSSVWIAWRSGMEYYLNNETIKIYFQTQKEYDLSYYGLFDEIKVYLE